jgi:hypothetical protein
MKTVKVTVRIPEQFFDAEIPESEWTEASDFDGKVKVADRYFEYANLDIKDELYGPDGMQVPGW